MADEMTGNFEIEVSWEDAPGVASPEIEATWARMVIKIDGRVVTLVSGADGTPRPGLYVSAYPLAEWISFNWWTLTSEVSVSSEPPVEWTWECATPGSWQQRHNVRAAGGGMSWPDLTIVPEGAVTSVTWRKSDPRDGGRGLRFLMSDRANLASDVVTEALAQFVEVALERLRERGIRDTPLEREWAAVASMDDEERAFAVTAGRLGLDPFAIDDSAANKILAISGQFENDLMEEILDASDSSVEGLREVGDWLQRADAAAGAAQEDAVNVDLLSHLSDEFRSSLDPFQPWLAGYALARRARDLMGSGGTSAVSRVLDNWTAKHVHGRAGGLEGFTVRTDTRALLLVPEKGYAPPATQERFLKARSLGAHLLQHDRTRFILTSTRTPLQRAARAFAAELLAPAAVIREMLTEMGGHADYSAVDGIASELGVSPLVIQHQYDNQIARSGSDDGGL